MADNLRRKCLKCGNSPRADPHIKLYRFPKPGLTNAQRCEFWAKFCFPDGAWFSIDFQRKLYAEHRMLCSLHFQPSSFTDFAEKKLNKFAVPDAEQVETQSNHVIDHSYAQPEPSHHPTNPIPGPSRKLMDITNIQQSIPVSNAHEEGNDPVNKQCKKKICDLKNKIKKLKAKKTLTALHLMDDFRTSCALINKFHVVIEDPPEALEYAVAESCADAGDSGPVEEQAVDDTHIGDDHDDDDSDTLVESNVCRVCLALDVKMYDLKDIELREMFQNITGIAVNENNHSILERLCWECAGRLKAAAAFRNKALLSDTLLQSLASTGEQIRKNDVTLIKQNQDYLNSAGTLSIVEVFHTVEIDAENIDTDIVQNTDRNDSVQLKESIIEENNDQMDVQDESMIEAPIKTEIEYDPICSDTAEENIVLETNPSSNIPLREDTINSAHSSPPPGCSHVEPRYPILGYLLKTPSDCENIIKKTVVRITSRDSISKIVPIKSKEVVIHDHTVKCDAKLKNINVKVGGISKKTSNKKLVKKTQVKANTLTDEEYLSLENFEF